MVKALVGALAGALVSALLCLALDARRAGGAPAEPAGQAPAPAAPSAEPRPPAGLAAARETLEELRKEAARLRSLPAPTAEARPARISMADLAKLLGAGIGHEWLWDDTDPRVLDMKFHMTAIFRDRAEAAGVNLLELAAGPDGSAALAMELLRSSDPPVDPAVLAQVEEAYAEMRKSWEEYREKRAGLSRLERAVELERMSAAMNNTATGLLDDAGGDRWWAVENIWEQAAPERYVGFYGVRVVSPGTEAEGFSKKWLRDLGLDASHEAVLKTIADGYLRELEELQAGAAARGFAVGHDEPLKAMIGAQRKIAEMINLTPEQARRLADFSEVPVPLPPATK